MFGARASVMTSPSLRARASFFADESGRLCRFAPSLFFEPLLKKKKPFRLFTHRFSARAFSRSSRGTRATSLPSGSSPAATSTSSNGALTPVDGS